MLSDQVLDKIVSTITSVIAAIEITLPGFEMSMSFGLFSGQPSHCREIESG